MKTGLIIKELRIKKGLTQEELAEKTELSARTIQRIENGEVDPRAYSLQMIAKALDVDFSLFVEDESTEAKDKNAKDNLFTLGLVHLSGMFLLFIPTIFIWTSKKNKVEGITDHFNDVISFQLTVWLVFILPGLVMLYFHRLNNINSRMHYMIAMVVILSALFSIYNTICVINNKPYKSLNFIKLKNKDKKDSK